MRSKEVAQRYAEALYDLGHEEKVLDELENSYRFVWERVKENDDFHRFLNHPLIPDGSKFELIDNIFQNKVHPYLLNYLQLLVRKNREPYIGDVYEEFISLREKKEEIVKVMVSSPYELAENGLLDRIKDRLKEIFGKKIRVETVLDKRLLAGIKLQVGETVIDGSLKARLDDLEDKLVGGQ